MGFVIITTKKANEERNLEEIDGVLGKECPLGGNASDTGGGAGSVAALPLSPPPRTSLHGPLLHKQY